MAQSHLTDLAVHKFTKPGVYWDDALPAFGVRVGKTKKTWVIIPDQRRVQKIIGHYPELPLAKARALARRHLAIRSQYVPLSFEEGYDQFLAYHQANTRPASYDTTKRHLSKLLPKLAKRPLGDVQTSEVMHPIDLMKRPSAALHTFVAARQFFRWCASRRYCSNVLEGVKPPSKSTPRARVLRDDELKALWTAAEQCGQFGVIVKLLAATGQRRGEIAALQISWIQNDTITIPAAVTKNGREHTFPIGTTTSDLLKPLLQCQTNLLFPARGSIGTPFNGWSKSKKALDKISGITEWTLHDIRRTVATRMAEIGIAPHIIERLLNHVTGTLSPIALVYNKARYLEEMRDAIERWETRLLQIIRN